MGSFGSKIGMKKMIRSRWDARVTDQGMKEVKGYYLHRDRLKLINNFCKENEYSRLTRLIPNAKTRNVIILYSGTIYSANMIFR